MYPAVSKPRTIGASLSLCFASSTDQQVRKPSRCWGEQFTHKRTAALKALHVISRTPSPSPAPPSQRSVDDMSKEELAAVVRASQRDLRRNVKEETPAAMKREEDREEADDEIEFVSSKRVKSRPSLGDEVIVLD